MNVLVALLFLMLVGAIVAVETTNLLSSIVCVGGVGFLLAIAFLFLGAPDIAITQIVVEILVLVILLRATVNRDLTTVSGDREFYGTVVTTVMVLVILMAAAKAFDQFPAFGESVLQRYPGADGSPSAVYMARSLADTGSANVVTGVLLDYRAYDTLGEATVLFCSVIGALTVLRKRARKSREELESEGLTDE